MRTRKQQEKYNLVRRKQHRVFTSLNDPTVTQDQLLFEIVDFIIEDVAENWTPQDWITRGPKHTNS